MQESYTLKNGPDFLAHPVQLAHPIQIQYILVNYSVLCTLTGETTLTRIIDSLLLITYVAYKLLLRNTNS